MHFHCDPKNKILTIFAEGGGFPDAFCVADRQGTRIALPIMRRESGNNGERVRLDASALAPWTPEHPVLYTLYCGNQSCRFGFSSLETVGNNAVLLNGNPIYLRGCIRGITAHEHPNMTGGSLKDAAVKYITQAKKYGFNLVRWHSTMPYPEFVETADELGFLIHAEIGFAFTYNERGEKTGLDMNATQWQDMIARYRNHPSMAIFCIGNEMHKSGHQPGVQTLYEIGKKMAPNQLILDNSGWGEYDRTSADIFCQHIAYYFPFKHHEKMFEQDSCWHLNGSCFDVPMMQEHKGTFAQAGIRREAVPTRPVLAHEAMHYIEISDYEALNRKFDAFADRVGAEYLAANGIEKPRFLTELPELIRQKGIGARLPKLIKASEEFKKMAIKRYIEQLRFSVLCGFEMLQLADCLKYENRNGIVDCFDDDKYIDAAWMRQFNGDSVLLMDSPEENFHYGETVEISIHLSCFTPNLAKRGTLKVTISCGEEQEEIYEGKDFVPVSGLHKLAGLSLRIPPRPQAARFQLNASFDSEELHLSNSWDLWFYLAPEIAFTPATALQNGSAVAAFMAKTARPQQVKDILVTDTLDETLFDELNAGKTVLLLYDRAAKRNRYFWHSTLERFKPCIWDRGSNLGGVVASEELRRAMGDSHHFGLNFQPLLEEGCKLNLDDFPVPVDELVYGADKPVRDRMKGLIQKIKHFIPEDTLRNFCHVAAIRVGTGKLVVCTMNQNNGKDAGWQSFFAGLINLLPTIHIRSSIDPTVLRNYLEQSTKRGPVPEDVMNHFWEIDNKPVEDTLFWESCSVDLRKLK